MRRDDDDTVRHLVLCWGSAPDSILCYALGLTDIDPIANGLIGERFIDPESGDMPELTLALDRSGVDALDRHLSKIHDGENVVRVGAFDHIRLVPLIDVDWGPLAYCTMPSWRESILFARAGCDVRSHADGPSGLLDTDTPEALAELLCQTDVDYGARLICDRPAHRIVPLRFDEAARKTVTQYQADVRLGLGVPINLVEHPLLTAIAATMARIDDRHGEVTEADFDAAPLDDPSIFESLSHDGAEQFFWNLLDIEPRGADAALARFAPANIRELAALLSVLATGRFRPGMTDELLARKTSWSATDEMLRGTDEAVVEILDDSFGLVIYQEQIMRLAMEMCDFTATEANLLRKLAGMHRDDLIRTEKRVWADGRADTIEHRWARQAVRRGHTVVETIRLWDMVLECAPIAYCKAHALTYAELMVRTAWLKAHYPDEYAECFVR